MKPKKKSKGNMIKSDWKRFMHWLNGWGDCFENSKTAIGNKRTEYGDGYQDAIRDTFNYIKFYKIIRK